MQLTNHTSHDEPGLKHSFKAEAPNIYTYIYMCVCVCVCVCVHTSCGII